jgi:hypothetical protein
MYDWSLARSQKVETYVWPFEVDKTPTPKESPPPQVCFALSHLDNHCYFKMNFYQRCRYEFFLAQHPYYFILMTENSSSKILVSASHEVNELFTSKEILTSYLMEFR